MFPAHRNDNEIWQSEIKSTTERALSKENASERKGSNFHWWTITKKNKFLKQMDEEIQFFKIVLKVQWQIILMTIYVNFDK